MAVYRVAELFSSINGEGPLAGQLAVFVRFAGCNLRCSYCDTTWANEPDVAVTRMDEAEIWETIKSTGIENVTLTGGEPLLQENIGTLITYLTGKGAHVEIETNGSVDLTPFLSCKAVGEEERSRSVSFTMDYKLAGSGMEPQMYLPNFSVLESRDTVKFVVSDRADLDRARELINAYDLTGICHVYLSPVFGRIHPRTMVEYMKEHSMNHVNLQIQMHKVIWNPDERGV